jgi:hypothetical protein
MAGRGTARRRRERDGTTHACGALSALRAILCTLTTSPNQGAGRVCWRVISPKRVSSERAILSVWAETTSFCLGILLGEAGARARRAEEGRRLETERCSPSQDFRRLANISLLVPFSSSYCSYPGGSLRPICQTAPVGTDRVRVPDRYDESRVMQAFRKQS